MQQELNTDLKDELYVLLFWFDAFILWEKLDLVNLNPQPSLMR